MLIPSDLSYTPKTSKRRPLPPPVPGTETVNASSCFWPRSRSKSDLEHNSLNNSPENSGTSLVHSGIYGSADILSSSNTSVESFRGSRSSNHVRRRRGNSFDDEGEYPSNTEDSPTQLNPNYLLSTSLDQSLSTKLLRFLTGQNDRNPEDDVPLSIESSQISVTDFSKGELPSVLLSNSFDENGQRTMDIYLLSENSQFYVLLNSTWNNSIMVSLIDVLLFGVIFTQPRNLASQFYM